jgi:hypothetical protein
MKKSDYEESPFAGRKTNRWVWIAPSVLLHVVILIVWLLLPEEPPRKPSQRKLTINRVQAEQLQQHVEDANLVLLQRQVIELQAIKQAMANIRESKMQNLMTFEEKMAVDAPRDAKDLFSRFIESQTKIMGAYDQLLKDANASQRAFQEIEEPLKQKNLEAATFGLGEIRSNQTSARGQLAIITYESDLLSGLVNSAEIHLEWFGNSEIDSKKTELVQAMQSARESTQSVGDQLNRFYGGAPGEQLDFLVEDLGKHQETLKADSLAEKQGLEKAEQTRQQLREDLSKTESEITDLKEEISSRQEEMKPLGNSREDDEKRNSIYGQIQSRSQNVRRAENRLRKDQDSLKKVKYSPDRNLERKVRTIESAIESLLKNETVEVEDIQAALVSQAQVAQASSALLKILSSGERK